MKTVIISQARTGSTRLPGKVIKDVLGKPLLAFHIERLQKVRNVDEIVIATTTKPEDDVIIALAKKLEVSYYRGSEDDVLSRYYEAAREQKADVVVRVTSDCPLIDPITTSQVIDKFVMAPQTYDYVSNTLKRTYPRGLDTEAFSMGVLEDIYRKAHEPADREHVTRYILTRPDEYRLGSVENEIDLSHYRWTVDEEDDFKLIKLILEKLYPQNPSFTFHDCLELVKRHPEWMKINDHVNQKQT